MCEQGCVHCSKIEGKCQVSLHSAMRDARHLEVYTTYLVHISRYNIVPIYGCFVFTHSDWTLPVSYTVSWKCEIRPSNSENISIVNVVLFSKKIIYFDCMLQLLHQPLCLELNPSIFLSFHTYKLLELKCWRHFCTLDHLPRK